jgi:F-type H+-transporting ATPase subunit gamma
VSTRQNLSEHLVMLHDLAGIMSALKNLSLMETHKLTRRLDAQRHVMDTIESAGGDFLGSHPDVYSTTMAGGRLVYVLIGSELGFCGNFNEAVLTAFGEEVRAAPIPSPASRVIACGVKLTSKLAGTIDGIVETIHGPNVAEEIPDVLSRLVSSIETLQRPGDRDGLLMLKIVYHEFDQHAGALRVFEPFRELAKPRRAFSCPPVLTLPSDLFWRELLQHYLFSALHYVFSSSLLSEHRRRVQHLETAIDRIGTETSDLTRKLNALRQEAITEEIEVILLSAEALKSRLE